MNVDIFDSSANQKTVRKDSIYSGNFKCVKGSIIQEAKERNFENS